MPQENIEIVRRLAEAFDERGFDGAREFFDPDIEWHEDPSFPEAGVYQGMDAVEAYARQFMSEFAEMHYHAVDLTDLDDQVIANMRISGEGQASGAAFEISAWWVFALREGKVIRCHAYLDREQALKAAGLK